jgi:anti-sigma B factor antagonist
VPLFFQPDPVIGAPKSHMLYTQHQKPIELQRSQGHAQMTDSRLRISDNGGVTLVEFVDRNILDEANIQAINEEITAVIEQASVPKILISFSNVDHLSSAALGALITINNKIREKSGALHLANIDPQIYEVFVITRLNKLFNIHETTDEAQTAFAS